MLKEIEKFIISRENKMFELLEHMVNINSWSRNPEGCRQVAELVTPILSDMGFTIRRIEHPEVAATIIAENTPRLEHGGGVLISGHLDTVFPVETGFLKYERTGDKVTGPGASDMKSGVTGALYALKALDSIGLLKDMPVAVVFNSDEEISSRFSRPVIEEAARNSDLAFVFEPSCPDGAVTIGRKGKMIHRLRTTGKAGHAGACPYPKSSAVEEMCRWVLELESLNAPQAGRSVNVGTISGGVGVNTIPYAAEAEIECRWVGTKDGAVFLQALETTAGKPVTPGTVRHIERGWGRPAMETSPGTHALYDIAAEVAGELVIPILPRFGGEVSDANFMAHVGTPVLDGLGPSGTNWHSKEECMSAKTLAERTILAAETIRRAWTAGDAFSKKVVKQERRKG